MPGKFLSPGVYETELDQSFLSQGVAGIGATMVGRTKKGPAFMPLFLQGYDTFNASFGDVDPNMQAVYASKIYLKNSTSMTFVKVLGHADGTTAVNGWTVNISAIVDSGSNGHALAVIHHTGTVAGGQLTATQVVGDNQNFVFKLVVGSTTYIATTASFVSSSSNYITKVLNTDPTKFSTYGHYVYANYTYEVPQVAMTASVVAVTNSLNSFQRDFEHGVTSFVKSQPIGGGGDFDLFRFHSLGDGRAAVDEIKVQISNIKPSINPLITPFGTFDVVVRGFYDTDGRPSILESYAGCTLDPAQNSFIAKRIGDKWEAFDTSQRKFVVTTGNYPNQSKLIRVEMNTAANYPPESLPWGHRGYAKLLFVSGTTVQDMPLTINQIDANGNIDANITWGISFVSGGIDDRMQAFPNSVTSLTGTDADFSLGFLTSSYTNGRQSWNYNTAIAQSQYHQAVYQSASLYKYCLPFLGGFDGWDIRVTDPLYLNNTDDDTVIGVTSAKRALDSIANPDAFDMNLLFTPGITNLKICDKARSVVNDRKDVLYIMDLTGSTVQEVIGNLKNRSIDDNYSAAYYPDLKYNDTTNKKIVRVSPSVAIAGAIAFSDRVGQVFFAPAGLNRGGLNQFGIIDVVDRLNFQDRNDLYDNRINPIATFPVEGIVVFGQKTLQVKPSALDRINVRRLLIFAKKTIGSVAKFLLFEPNNAATWQRFNNSVNPILEKIRQDQGLEAFKVVMDSSTNTSDLIDRNIMTGKIFLKPTRAAEFIDLSFIITNSGVDFGS